MTDQEFEYGEEVMVRESDNKPWVKRHYAGIMPNLPWYYTMPAHYDPSSFNGDVKPWKEIRKIQKPEPANNSESIEDFVKRMKTEIARSKEILAKTEDGTVQLLYVKFIEKLVNNLESINASSDGRAI